MAGKRSNTARAAKAVANAALSEIPGGGWLAGMTIDEIEDLLDDDEDDDGYALGGEVTEERDFRSSFVAALRRYRQIRGRHPARDPK